MDGRRVHWVQSFRGGDRYSLIFYDTTGKAPTPKGRAVLDLLPLEQGGGGAARDEGREVQLE